MKLVKERQTTEQYVVGMICDLCQSECSWPKNMSFNDIPYQFKDILTLGISNLHNGWFDECVSCEWHICKKCFLEKIFPILKDILRIGLSSYGATSNIYTRTTDVTHLIK